MVIALGKKTKVCLSHFMIKLFDAVVRAKQLLDAFPISLALKASSFQILNQNTQVVSMHTFVIVF